MTPPVVVIGMHRSGTSLVVASLQRLGLFAGGRKDSVRNYEAAFFRQLNDWLLNQSGATWDHPAPFLGLLEAEDVRSLEVEYLHRVVHSRRVVGFMGPARYLRYRAPEALPPPWGWKDPRNTFTLPIWTEVFPNPRVVHVVRHGVDVASSLRARHRRTLARRAAAFRDGRGGLRAGSKGFTETVRCATLEGGFSLWEEYVDQARSHLDALGGRGVEVAYENLLSDPGEVLGELSAFCGLSPSPRSLAEVATGARPDRALAFRGRPELEAFAEAVGERLRARGYPGIGTR